MAVHRSAGCGSMCAIALTILPLVLPIVARADTINDALAMAYRTNPQLNAQRAALRGTDENVPQALSGYRPKVGIVASIGEQRNDLTETSTSIFGGGTTYTSLAQTASPYSYGLSATQTLFNGFQTANRTRAAESQVSAGREALRILEQNILVGAATAYMDYLRDTALVQVYKSNASALAKVLQETQKRFRLADVTATDVAQARAQLAAAESAVLAAESTQSSSAAIYRAVIGIDPHNLAPGQTVDRFSPNDLAAAIETGENENPNVTAAMYGIDVAFLQTKVAEGALLPTAIVQALVQQNTEPQIGETQLFTASLLGQLTIPLYQGGAEYSLIRQSKESLTQQRLNLDLIRNQVRTQVVQTWSQRKAAQGELEKAKVGVSAAAAAVDGIGKELLAGERTTFDLLNAQQVLVNARAALIVAQHDRVVASYTLLGAVGRLSPQTLNLPTKIYDPSIHYQKVRDSWAGVRTPDGER